MGKGQRECIGPRKEIVSLLLRVVRHERRRSARARARADPTIRSSYRSRLSNIRPCNRSRPRCHKHIQQCRRCNHRRHKPRSRRRHHFPTPRLRHPTPVWMRQQDQQRLQREVLFETCLSPLSARTFSAVWFEFPRTELPEGERKQKACVTVGDLVPPHAKPCLPSRVGAR